jgi:abortive infection bacteriophage resistance protein
VVSKYEKPWLPIEDQLHKLRSRGVEVPDVEAGLQLLRSVGYYRLTGYLYPFRKSEEYVDDQDRSRIRVLDTYRAGTSMTNAASLIDFDRELRLLVLDGIERIEISLRTQIGYQFGRRSAFAHLDPVLFTTTFTDRFVDPETGESSASSHEQWLGRMRDRQAESDEAFVAHFRDKYEDQMPIWALTEIMEMGHLGRLYRGSINSVATELAHSYGAPSKKVMQSWIGSLIYVRNVSAHHARLFNRKLVNAPSRPKQGEAPVLDHLRDASSAKQIFGVYNVLAVMAYLLRSIEPHGDWAHRTARLIDAFPSTGHIGINAMGVPSGWASFELWQQ